ncbi:hypothetical protein V6C42_15715 [Pseudoclostridium thermosuccinogenes]|jgi:hypothetical protein|uniref:hypothetical protein n=1 Tax=Clostridium thermosuccinogenes TaxID=84032 RepID=UPI002FD9A877
MKKKFLILPVLTVSIFAFVACSTLQLDTDDVKVIDKPKTEDKIEQNQGSGTGQNKDDDKQKSDLNEKGEVLQKDTEEYIKSIIDDRATEVLTALKDYDLKKLSQYIHPDKGVRFSPYGYVDVKENLVFTAEEIESMDESKVYMWGYYDGSGEPIELTFPDYHKRFIYDEDFINADEVGYNKALGHGNSLNNSFEVYKNSIIVEYHFPGIDPQYEGMDWRSLRLVFEKKSDQWYIVGIIHDQWTI